MRLFDSHTCTKAVDSPDSRCRGRLDFVFHTHAGRVEKKMTVIIIGAIQTRRVVEYRPKEISPVYLLIQLYTCVFFFHSFFFF